MESFKKFLSRSANDNAKNRGRSNIPNTGKQKGQYNSSGGVHHTIKAWHKDSVKKSNGDSATTMHAYESYLNHVEKNGHEPVPLQSFTRQWQQHSGHHVGKIAGRVRHIGVSVK